MVGELSDMLLDQGLEGRAEPQPMGQALNIRVAGLRVDQIDALVPELLQRAAEVGAAS